MTDVDPMPPRAVAAGAIAGLLSLKAVMLAALFSGTPPAPPGVLAPFIGAGIAVGVLALVLAAAGARGVRWPARIFAVFALVSYGPHKLLPLGHPLLSAQTPAVYPAILAGTALVGLMLWAVWRMGREGAGPAPA